MADNVVLPGTGNTIATDKIGGVDFQRVKLTLGADGANDGDVSSSNPVPVSATLAASELHIGEVGGRIVTVSQTMTRPADSTAYAVGDLVSNSTTAGSCVPLTLVAARATDKSFSLRAARLKVTGTNFVNWLNSTIRVHIFVATGTFPVGDNAPFIGLNENSWLGYFEVTLAQQFADCVKGVGGPFVTSGIDTEPVSTTQNIYAVFETRSAPTPGSGNVFSLSLATYQN